MNYKIIDTLRRLGVNFQETDANEEGWLVTNACYRKDGQPSMGINLENGSYTDFAGKAPGGSIIDLVTVTLNCSREEAYEYVNGKGNKNQVLNSRKESFWDEEKKNWLKKCQQILKSSKDSELVQMAKDYDGLNFETMIKFGCGLDQSFIGGSTQDALVFPYETGVQFYTRNKKGKVISMKKGSKPKDSFFGKDQLSGLKKLIIAKSPREAMLFHQELGESFDVISIASGEVAKLSGLQKIFLNYQLKRVNKVYVSFDRDTKQAEDIAFGFARSVRDIDNNYGLDIELLNISKLTGDQCKDFTDLVKSNQKNRIGELFSEGFKYSDYVWNTVAQENKIWHTDHKGKVSISQVGLARKLKKQGFGKIYYKDSSEPLMVRKVENVLSQPSNNQLNDFIKNEWIKKYSKIVDRVETEKGPKYVYASEVEDKYFSYDTKIMNPNYVAKLDVFNVQFMKDTKDTGYLYFSDKVVKVQSNSVEEIKYSDLTGVIWDTQINNRSFTLSQNYAPNGVYSQFLKKVSADNPKRVKAIQSHIGYLIHTFKNRAKGLAVILTDEQIGNAGSANGGTGKGIVAESIGHIRKKAYIDGKIFDYKSRFAYQDIKPGDQYLFIDDLQENFEFSYFFPALTNDLTVEPKGQNRFTIPFEYSPKFVLSTNYPLGGNSDSYRRRQSIVEFAPYFNKTHTPEKEFGHLFFSEWDDKEWNKFDNLMIYCLQVYLTDGLVTCSINYERKQLGLQTSPEFVEWAEKYLEAELEYDPRKLFRGNCSLFNNARAVASPKNKAGSEFPAFGKICPEILDINKQARTFNVWLKLFGEFKGWEVLEHPKNGYNFILFSKK